MPDISDHPAIPDPVEATPLPRLEYEDLEKGEQIGAGGDANVYQASLSVDGEPHRLALKEPRFEGTVRMEIFDQFEEEAETWANLDDHNNIVTVHGYGAGSVPWIALEYMDGGTLADKAEEIEFEEALWIAGRIAEGIRHGHRHGIAHLDLKPSNVLIRETPGEKWNYPKVSDWGLAKMLLEHSKSVEGLSPTYAAPEQFNADEYGRPDDVTDVYQFGTIIYELLTGQPPFTGAATEVMQSVLNKTPSKPSEINPDLPPEVDQVILDSLAKQKSDRYESILLFRQQIDDIFYKYATDKDITIDISTSNVRENTKTNISSEESTDRANIITGVKDSIPFSRRNAMIVFGTVGTGGAVFTLGNRIFGLSNKSSSNSNDGNGQGESGGTTIPLNEAWTMAESSERVLPSDEAFIISNWNRITARYHDTGAVKFDSGSFDNLSHERAGNVDFSARNGLAFGDNGIYIGTSNGNDTSALLIALNNRDGSEKFIFETPSDLGYNDIRNVSQGPSGNIIFSASKVEGSDKSYIFSIDPENGDEIWRTEISRSVGGLEIINDMIYAGNAFSFTVLESSSGERQESINRESINFSGGTFLTSYFKHDDNIIFPGNPITAFNPESNSIVWETPTPGGSVPGRLRQVDSNLYGFTDTGNVFQLDSQSGETIWSTQTNISQRSGDYEPPAVLGSNVFIGGREGKIIRIRKNQNNETDIIEENALTVSGPTAPMETVNDILFVGGEDGTAYELNNN